MIVPGTERAATRRRRSSVSRVCDSQLITITQLKAAVVMVSLGVDLIAAAELSVCEELGLASPKSETRIAVRGMDIRLLLIRLR